MSSLGNFLRTPRGKVVGIAATSLAVIVGIIALYSFFGTSKAARVANHRLFICSETGKTFEADLKIGTTIPTHSPHSGKDTGWPAELCYWNKDGTTRKEPTAVLLKSYLGERGPTFCKDCGRLVVGHNPMPAEGMRPPPTEEEYRQKRPSMAGTHGERQ
jgi:hypothetical protein